MSDMKKSAGIICISAILALFSASAGFAANADYAALPPFLSASVQPNALLVMDFSGSMQGPANYGGEFRGYDNYTAQYVGACHQEYNSYYGYYYYVVDEENITYDNYDNSETYYGYFDSDEYYSYDDTNNYWEVDPDYSGSGLGHADTSLSGNFLNFLVMSRMDVALKSLIGGKAETQDGDTILVAQGADRTVEVSNLDAECHVRPADTQSPGNDMLISISDQSSSSSEIGTFSNRYARVKLENAADREGIVQKNAHKVRFGFIAYADSRNDVNEGTIKYGVHEDNVDDDLVDAMQNTMPYSGTHTGEAMEEAYNYLKQENMFSYNTSTDNDYEGKATAVDPYYEVRNGGTADETVEPAWCRKSYVVLISDGEWNGSEDPADWAHSIHTEDLRPETDTDGNELLQGDQNADVSTLFAFSSNVEGVQSMKTVAAFGSYEDLDDDGCSDSAPYDFSVDSDNNLSGDSTDVSFPTSNCDPDGTYDDCCAEWDKKGGTDGDGKGVPDSFYSARSGEEMATALSRIFQEIEQGTASGTAVTAITSRTTSASIISQAVFFPEKVFGEGQDAKSVTWTGNLYTEWYLNTYLDGNLVQNIREDSTNEYTLDIGEDRILEYLLEDDILQVDAYDSNPHDAATDPGKKASTSPQETYESLDDVANLLDFGEELEERVALDRDIYGVDVNDKLREFNTTTTTTEAVVEPASVDAFKPLLGTAASEFPECLVDGTIQYEDLINFVRGETVSKCRSRTTDTGNVWKLGDVISSTPTVVNYGDYRMIYTGSNDGMLHAFRVGYIKSTGNDASPVELCDDDAAVCSREELAKEEWAFLPKDSMPYLRYMASPEYDHIYTTDMKPYIINTRDKTILIGGMRLGGACGNGPVNPPADTAPIGLSAYFALDITDPLKPKYMWRFTDQDLGFTYSGPAHVRRRDASGELQNYVIFASGPTDYDGTSVQPLKIYVLDLDTGKSVREQPFEEESINNGFGGRLFTDGLDIQDKANNVEKDGETDFVFLGYTSNADQSEDRYGKMNGGIYKIYTVPPNPENWEFDTFLGAAVQNPVTAPITVMDCFPEKIPYPYLYFGTGRYFVSNDVSTGAKQEHLFGVPFTCNINNENCSNISQIGNSDDLDCSTIDNIETQQTNASWKIPLNPAQGDFLEERCNTEATTTNDNIVLFDTIMPTDVVCECGGKSRSFAINCATGKGLGYDKCPDSASSYMIGVDKGFNYLLQLSGGDIRQFGRENFDEGSGSTEDHLGLPPEEGGSLTDPFGKTTYWKQW